MHSSSAWATLSPSPPLHDIERTARQEAFLPDLLHLIGLSHTFAFTVPSPSPPILSHCRYLDLSFNPIRNVGDLYRATQRKSDVSRATLALQIPLSMLPEGQPGLQVWH